MKPVLFLIVLCVLSANASEEYDEDVDRPIALPKYPLPKYTENGTIEWFPRIIGGTQAREGEFAGKVSVQTVRGFHFCGGTLINEYNVLTAAHCVTDEVRGRPQPINPRSIRVMAGDLSVSMFNPSSTRQLRNVVFIFYHPNYSPITLIHDVAVLRLIHPFFHSTNTHPIDLSLVTPNPGTNCRLAGWGSTEEDGPGSINLLRVNLGIISTNVCNGNQELNGLIREGMLCAGVLAGGRDACQGDSGGGLICNDVVAGIVSFGIGCGRPNLPGVYADVSFYNAWIEDVFQRSDGTSSLASIGLISFLIILIQSLK